MRRLLFALALLSSPALAAAPTVFRATLDPTIGAVYSDAPSLETLSGWLWVAPGDLFGEPSPSDWAPVRVVTSSPGALYVAPYPVESGRHVLRAVEAPLLFADGFERGDLWAWGAAVGADPSLRAGGEIDLRLAMAESVGWYNVLSFSGLDSGGSTVYVLLSEGIGGGSASTDTPASKRYRYTLRSFDSVSWKAIRQESGWPDAGGVVDHVDYHVVADNTRNPSTNVGPLDDLQDLTFKGQAATMYAVRLVWDDTLKRWWPEDLADAQVLWKGTILDAAFAGVTDSEFSMTIREQTKEGLKVPGSPVELQGLGGGVKVETAGAPGSGARIIQPDVSAARGTGDQWHAWGILRGTGDTGSSNYVFFDHPTVRLQRGVAANTIIVEIKNAAGTWQPVGTSPTFTASTFFGILVNYDLSSTTAELWVNGVSAGSTVITSGIFASSTSSNYWYNAPTTGTIEITHFFYRQGGRLLADSEIADRSQYVFDFDSETSLNIALEFKERTGTSVGDEAQSQSAVLTGFADANGAWVASGTGDAPQSRTRPLVTVGRPFMAKLFPLDVAKLVFSPGYEGETRAPRFVAADGARLASSPTNGTGITNFIAANRQIDIFSALTPEPAIGQSMTFSAGPNAGAHTIDRILIDPVRGVYPLTAGYYVVNGAITGDAGRSGTWSGTGAYSDFSGSALMAYMNPVQVTSGATDHMSLCSLTAGSNDDSRRLVGAYLERLGPASSPTTSALKTLSLEEVGWQGDGADEAFGQADTLARVTPSTDNGPSVVYRNSAGTYLVTGSDLSPSAGTYTWDSLRIKSATQAAFPGEYNKVVTHYAKAWNKREAGGLPSASVKDALATEAAIEWRSVPSGTGTKELPLYTYFLSRADAKAFGDAILSMLSGKLYVIELYGPIKTTEAAMAPFTAVTVDWSADSYLDGGVNGIVVGLDVHPDKSATALVFFGS